MSAGKPLPLAIAASPDAFDHGCTGTGEKGDDEEGRCVFAPAFFVAGTIARLGWFCFGPTSTSIGTGTTTRFAAGCPAAMVAIARQSRRRSTGAGDQVRRSGVERAYCPLDGRPPGGSFASAAAGRCMTPRYVIEKPRLADAVPAGLRNVLSNRYPPTLCHDLLHQMICGREPMHRIRHYRAS